MNRTSKLGVDTADAFIRHLPIYTEHGMVEAPVKVTFRKGFERGSLRLFVDPVCRDGKLVFALPGGGEVVE